MISFFAQLSGPCPPAPPLKQTEENMDDKQPEYEFECPRCGHCCQQREWVGLTDDEIPYTRHADQSIIRWAEAKLKEKNT